ADPPAITPDSPAAALSPAPPVMAYNGYAIPQIPPPDPAAGWQLNRWRLPHVMLSGSQCELTINLILPETTPLVAEAQAQIAKFENVLRNLVGNLAGDWQRENAVLAKMRALVASAQADVKSMERQIDNEPEPGERLRLSRELTQLKAQLVGDAGPIQEQER